MLAARLDDVRHGRQPPQHPRELLEIIDGDDEREVRDAGLVIGPRGDGIDAEALDGEHIRQVTQQAATIVGAYRKLHGERPVIGARPVDLQDPLGFQRRHTHEARAVAAMHGDATAERHVAGDGLRP